MHTTEITYTLPNFQKYCIFTLNDLLRDVHVWRGYAGTHTYTRQLNVLFSNLLLCYLPSSTNCLYQRYKFYPHRLYESSPWMPGVAVKILRAASVYRVTRRKICRSLAVFTSFVRPTSVYKTSLTSNVYANILIIFCDICRFPILKWSIRRLSLAVENPVLNT